jgi:uncharacterized protein YjiS (DUF1127 family)
MSSFASAALRPWTGLTHFATRLSNLALTIGLAMQVRKERRMLMRLDDRALQDIGFDKGRAYGEAARTFWDVPANRQRYY